MFVDVRMAPEAVGGGIGEEGDRRHGERFLAAQLAEGLAGQRVGRHHCVGTAGPPEDDWCGDSAQQLRDALQPAAVLQAGEQPVENLGGVLHRGLVAVAEDAAHHGGEGVKEVADLRRDAALVQTPGKFPGRALMPMADCGAQNQHTSLCGGGADNVVSGAPDEAEDRHRVFSPECMCG